MKPALALMVASTLLYALNGTIDYLVIKRLPLSTSIISIALGVLAGFIVAKLVFNLRVNVGNSSQYVFGAITALMITAYTLLLLVAYRSYTLASIYPLIGLSALVFFAGPIFVNSPYFALGILGGFAFSLASAMELRAMKMTKARGNARMLIKRNFINDFEYSDTLLVLLGSVIIGSFYPIELLGGILIVTGIILMGMLSRQ